MNKVFKKFTDLTGLEKKKLLSWWSDGTRTEKHTITMTPESLESDLLGSIIVYIDNEIAGAAGIFSARNKEGIDIYHNDQLVVELGSNFISKKFRGRGLGRELLNRRIALSRRRRWFPVSVTTNPAMQHIFKKIGAFSMDNKKMNSIRNALCLCIGATHDTSSCPLERDACWFFN